MDWVRVGGLVILPDGSVSQILNISDDNGIKVKGRSRWFCRTELSPLNKEKQMTDWYDYENKKAISLPPVGDIVITYSDRIDKEFKVKILEHTNNGVSDICVCRVINDSHPNLGKLGYYLWFKPLDWEKDVRKDKLIDTVCKLILDMGGLSYKAAFTELYDLGYLKFPEEQ